MFDIYLKEFMAICSHLEANDCPVHKGFYKILRSDFDAMLDKNQYELSQTKLKTWKSLNWIAAYEGRLTKRIYDAESKKYNSYVMIDEKVFKTLKELTTAASNLL